MSRRARRILAVASGIVVAHCGARSGLDVRGGDFGALDDGGANDGLVDGLDLADRFDARVQPEVPEIAAGEAHACVRTGDGAVYCWGENSLGQLGDGTLADRGSAVRVEGLPKVVGIAAGTHHTCALAADGNVWCWGGNSQAELGLGARADPATRPTLRPGPPAKAIAANGWHTCALGADGTVTCWGRNASGECAIGGAEYVLSASPIPDLGGVTALAAGVDHTCAIVAGGEVRCWGKNTDGQLGNGESTARELVPVKVHDLDGAVALTAGDDHTCAILGVDGSMKCWGDGFLGELGDGRILGSPLPVVVQGVSGATAAAGGLEHTCAVARGTVYCWGKGLQGQLGNGATPVIQKVPVALAITDARSVCAGDAFSCAAVTKGVKCWGANDHGQLGNGEQGDAAHVSAVPVDVTGF